MHSAKTGMKAMLREPSANNLLNRLGILNATKKASELSPAPKNHAMTTSLIKPKIWLTKVAEPTTPAALVTRSFSAAGWQDDGLIGLAYTVLFPKTPHFKNT
jgi:hypothetical protein